GKRLTRSFGGRQNAAGRLPLADLLSFEQSFLVRSLVVRPMRQRGFRSRFRSIARGPMPTRADAKIRRPHCPPLPSAHPSSSQLTASGDRDLNLEKALSARQSARHVIGGASGGT